MASLEYRYGPMNSGKSMAIIQLAYNYEENGKKALLIKSILDTKGDNYLVSRVGAKRQIEILLGRKEKLLSKKYYDLLIEKDVILVDEAQFLTKKQVEELWYITKMYNINVICYGLKTNFKSEFFEGSKRLFELADKLKELETLCSCGKKAKFNARKVDNIYTLNGDEVLIDTKEANIKYVPLCSSCYLKKVFNKQKTTK